MLPLCHCHPPPTPPVPVDDHGPTLYPVKGTIAGFCHLKLCSLLKKLLFLEVSPLRHYVLTISTAPCHTPFMYYMAIAPFLTMCQSRYSKYVTISIVCFTSTAVSRPVPICQRPMSAPPLQIVHHQQSLYICGTLSDFV